MQAEVMRIGRRRFLPASRSASRRVRPLAKLIDAVDEHDGVVDDDADEDQKPDDRHDVDRLTGERQADDRADRAERHREHDHERVHERLELAGHHQVDEEHGQCAGEEQRAEGALHLFLLSAERGGDARRHGFRAKIVAHVGSDFAHVAAVEIAGDHDGPLLADAADLGRTPREAMSGDGFEVDGDAFALRDDEIADVFDRRRVAIDERTRISISRSACRKSLATSPWILLRTVPTTCRGRGRAARAARD